MTAIATAQRGERVSLPFSMEIWANAKYELDPKTGIANFINPPNGEFDIFAIEDGFLTKFDDHVTIFVSNGGRIWSYGGIVPTVEFDHMRAVALPDGSSQRPSKSVLAGQKIGVRDVRFVPSLGLSMPGPDGSVLYPDPMAVLQEKANAAAGANEMARAIGANPLNPTEEMVPINPDTGPEQASMVPSERASAPIQISKRGLALGLVGVAVFGTIIGVAIAASKKKKGNRR